MSAALVELSEVLDLDAVAVLDALTDTDDAERRAAARKLELAYQWAVLHPASEHPGFLDEAESLGGDGTPTVAAFTAEPLAVRLRMTPSAAAALIGDALDLVHRHPRLWRKVLDLTVPVWRARRVVQQTRALPLASARWVDDQLARRADDACGPVVVDRLVAQLTATAEPETQLEREEAAQASWEVTLAHPDPTLFAGTSYLEVTGDTVVLQELDELVSAVAHQLHLDGDTRPLGVRKIQALRLITRRAAAGGDGLARADRIRLYAHVDADDLEPLAPGDDPFAVGRVEKLGAATVARIRQWVGHHQLTIVPVLNLQRGDAVDVHDPPTWMRELVVLRDRHCVFPGCGRDARSCDLDHIEPYDPDGPPNSLAGQTRPDNLAPLCRRHHRAKTSGLWRYRRMPDGSCEWTGPLFPPRS